MMRKSWIFTSVVVALVALALGVGPGWAQPPEVTNKLAAKKLLDAERKAAAARAKGLGLKPGVAGLAAAALPLPGIEGPGGVPHYFGPYGNWAFSPLPKGNIGTITVDAGGTGYTAPTVAILDVYGTGDGLATATIDPATQIDLATGAITGITVTSPGSGYSAPIVVITDDVGVDAAATANLTGLTGGIPKFVDRMPGLGPAGANGVTQTHGDGQYIPVAVTDTAAYPGSAGPPAVPASDYYEIALVEYSEKLHSSLPPTRLRGYVQLETPGALAAIAASRADGDPTNDLPLSKNVSVGGGKFAIDNPHYLGPVIVAKGRVHGIQAPGADPGDPVPVRIKFYNLLPTGSVDAATGRRPGDLFLPTDETIMGSGLGPALPGTAGEKYTQNRATIHLHGNNTVWISDGNVHQWITPAGETSADGSGPTPYPKGVSVRNVPDMGADCDPGNQIPPVAGNSGCQTFYYTNAQSARLQFYHDHAMGITRLNVYAGEAAGYVLTDAVENDMIAGDNVTGVNPNKLQVLPGLGIPLVIQDRTFVDSNTVFAQDPTWNWGTGFRNPPVSPETVGRITEAVTGDLWYPHVYMSVQNPADPTGTNAFGRWHYGPWFNPPTPECVNGLPVGCIEVGPVPNPYCLPTPPTACNVNGNQPDAHDCSAAPWEPPCMPGVPNPSMPGESFLDTQLVNGTVYPYLEVEPKAYRFRVLNASNDRFLNLQLYVAADKTTPTTPGTEGTVICDNVMTRPDGTKPLPADCTEVKMVPVSVAPLNQFADTPSGIPDPATKGPDWILIGTEGGFLPKPVVVPQQPIGYNTDPAYFAFGLVNQYSLFLGSAERADVVVDFSQYAGKTLILYNDSPAPVPAGAAPYDYFTGSPSQVDAGGAPTTQPGYGPNTRTIMQIRVADTLPAAPYDRAALNSVFAKTATKRGVFEVSQDPIIIPQAAYDTAYNATFPSTATEQYIQLADTAKTFKPINEQGVPQPAVTLPLEMKAMHDEMGGVYDTLFGRMSGMLGLTNPQPGPHVLLPYGLASPPTDLVLGSVEGTPIGVMPDGTQIWRIFHNGVDTHTIHTHLFHTQLINRVDQSGQVVKIPPSIELGWKDTFRVNPLEVTYLAMRPTVPTPDQLPFEVPDSVRLIDPTLPEGAWLIPPPPTGWFDPAGNQIEPGIQNHYVNFGWEYVWHCHILSHEEMDMMHTLVFAVPPRAPAGLTAAPDLAAPLNNPRVILSWTDTSEKEARFDIQRATDAQFTTGLATFSVPANTVTYTDTTVANNSWYWYRVFAIGNLVGDVATPGFPTMSADSVSGAAQVLVGAAPGTPTAPTNLTATRQAGPQVSLTWKDNATNETGFAVERCTGAGCTNFARIAVAGPRNNTGNVTYVDTTVTAGNDNSYYSFRVKALNSAGASDNTNIASVIVPAIPAAPTNARVAVAKANGNNYTATLNWAHPGGDNLTNFTIQRATDPEFTAGLNSSTVAGNLRTATQTVTRNTTYYWRIRANNNISGSSAWTKVLTFPTRTGP